jgi:excisionase family DNA binding protein
MAAQPTASTDQADRPATKLAYGVTEVAELLSVGRTTVYELIRTDQLRTLKIGTRRLISHEDLEAFVDAARSKGVA